MISKAIPSSCALPITMPPPTLPEREVLSISALTYRLRMHLEREFASVWVEGEGNRLQEISSGHWYLTLKDSPQLQAIVHYAGKRPAEIRAGRRHARDRPRPALGL